MTKRCSRCKRDLPVEAFYVSPSQHSGYSGLCKECAREYQRNYSPEKKAKFRATRAAKQYGITVEEFLVLQESAQDGCLLCRRSEVRMTVDHCHESDQVRGYICAGCNLGLGYFQDDPEALRRAAAYIEASRDHTPVVSLSGNFAA